MMRITMGGELHYALRDLLGYEAPKGILELKEKEQKQREGYERKPVKRGQFRIR